MTLTELRSWKHGGDEILGHAGADWYIQSLFAEAKTEVPAKLEKIGGFVPAPECSNAWGEAMAKNGA
jgi:hypothetical protein